MSRLLLIAVIAVATSAAADALAANPDRSLGPVPEKARLVLDEDWSGGNIDPKRWYAPRKKWGDGNHGVTPANVRIARDTVAGVERPVLVCGAHGDRYDGPTVGHGGKKTRVGGMVFSKQFFASGRFEVVMKVGSAKPHPGGPPDPRRPAGTVPAIWTYAYRYVSVPRERMEGFVRDVPLYNPHMCVYGGGGQRVLVGDRLPGARQEREQRQGAV